MTRVEIEITGKLLDELSEAFFWEEQCNALELTEGLSGKPNVFTVARVSGLSITIRPANTGCPISMLLTKVKKQVIQFRIAAVCEVHLG